MDNRTLDNISLSGFGSLIGIEHGPQIGLALAVAPWAGQVLTWLLMTVGGAVLLHFVNLVLKRYWPHQNDKTKARDGDDNDIP
jgi:hypothetical protein